METEQTFYRPPETSRQAAPEYSTGELLKRKELTDAIVANLKVIRADATDLSRLERKLTSISTALLLTRELADAAKLDVLEKRLASIATAIRVIEEDEIVKELNADH